MKPVNSSHYIAGGYFVTKSAARCDWMDAALFSKSVMSATTCIGDMIPHVWSTDWPEYGVRPSDLLLLEAWVGRHYNHTIGYTNLFFSPAIAKEFMTTFFPSLSDYQIIGIGLDHGLVDTFMAHQPQSTKDGLHTILKRNVPLFSNGTLLGFEVIGTEFGAIRHSLLCSSFYEIFTQTFNNCHIAPNNYGLFDTLTDATIYTEAANRQNNTNIDGWLPWLVMDYSHGDEIT